MNLQDAKFENKQDRVSLYVHAYTMLLYMYIHVCVQHMGCLLCTYIILGGGEGRHSYSTSGSSLLLHPPTYILSAKGWVIGWVHVEHVSRAASLCTHYYLWCPPTRGSTFQGAIHILHTPKELLTRVTSPPYCIKLRYFWKYKTMLLPSGTYNGSVISITNFSCDLILEV